MKKETGKKIIMMWMRRFEKKEKEEKMKERSGIKKTKRLCRRAEMD